MTTRADLEPPSDLAYGELPAEVLPEIPDWLLEWPLTWDEPPPVCGGGCACGGAPEPVQPDPVPDPVPVPVRWAVPGVWDDEPAPAPAITASVGPLVAQLVDVLGQLATIDPTALEPGQALGEAEALLGVQRAVRVLQLARTEDVAGRLLHEHRGFRSTSAWLASVAPDAPRADRTLARRLRDLPHLAAAVHAGRVSLAGTAKTAAALGKIGPHLDRPDGLVDGVDGEAR